MKLLPFDTRDTKPKLRLLLALSLLAAAAVGLLVILAPEKSALPACVITAVYCLGAVLLLLYALREQIRYNPYSYNTIFYFAFALFGLSVMSTHVYLASEIALRPEAFTASVILRSLLGSARNYMLLSLPFVLLFSAALCVSNVSLMRHEGVRPIRFLGIFLSILLVGGEVLLLPFGDGADGGRDGMIREIIVNFFAALYLYYECLLIGTMAASALAALHEPERDKDFLLILGCGINKDGTPTPLLRGRIDRAIAFDKKQQAETGKKLTFVTSGGKGSDEVLSESACMKRYMLEQGIPEERIIEEDKSTTTYENMVFSKEKLGELGPDVKVAFSTSDFHVFRSGLYARRVKIRAVGMGARTKWYFWPNAAVRELACLVVTHKVKQALIMGSLVAGYAVLTVLAYTLQ